jgi:putative hydrolase of the HAD superfamily
MMSKDKANVKAIFFDLDDTLCAYWEASKIGLRSAFENHGPAGHTADELLQSWAAAFREFSPTLKQTGWYEGYCVSGEPTRTEQMRLTLERLGINDAEMANNLSNAYREGRNNALRLFPEAVEVLQTLQRQYPLGLITNGPADIQREEIATLHIAHYFDHIFIEGEMMEGKPLQAVFRRAEAAVGLQPYEILFVGNSYGHDIKPALEAGWHAIWVKRDTDVPPSRSKGEDKPAGDPEPDLTVDDLRDVLRWLESRTAEAPFSRATSSR